MNTIGFESVSSKGFAAAQQQSRRKRDGEKGDAHIYLRKGVRPFFLTCFALTTKSGAPKCHACFVFASRYSTIA